MASVIEICNAALLMFGDDTVVSLTDPTPCATCGRGTNTRVALCASFWPIIRDATLRAHPWACAKKRAALALLTDAPVFGYDYQFALPADCLRILNVEDDFEFKIETFGGTQKVLLCDESACNVLYIAKIEDPTMYDSMLVQAMIYNMAAMLAKAVTGNATVAQQMYELYGMALQAARSTDGMDSGYLGVIEADDFVSVR